MNDRPIIGLVPLWDEEKESYWMLPGYMKAVELAGGIPLMLPLTGDGDAIEQLLSGLDGIILTGGQDVAPELYHEEPMEGMIVGCAERDSMEWKLLEAALEKKMPVFGICRGIQVMNVFFGGTLYQDIPTQLPSAVVHRPSGEYGHPSHENEVLQGTPLRDLLNADRIPVNSHHHQGIKELGKGLTAMARSDDGLVEAIVHTDYPFVWAVQWHPELSYVSDENSVKLISAFVNASSDYKRGKNW